MSRVSAFVIAVLCAVGAAIGLTRPYAIEPIKAAWSGKVIGDPEIGGVGQTVTCCWDELDSASGGYVELFCGYHESAGKYNLDIKDYQTELTVA